MSRNRRFASFLPVTSPSAHSTPARDHRITLFLIAALIAGTAACSRSMNVGTAPTPVFAISVTNSTGEEMIVSYDDGSGRRALGAIAAGATDRFVIAQPARTTVDVSARNSGGTRTVGPISVTLVAGETRPVTLR